MKKSKIKLSFLFLLGLILTGCNPNQESETDEDVLLTYRDNDVITFAQDEYLIHSGDAVTVEQNIKGVTYRVIGANQDKVTLDAKTGVFQYDDSIINMTQVLYVASYKNYETVPVVVTLQHDYEVADIYFRNLSNYIVDGEFITAYASLPYAVTYRLKEPVFGISLHPTTGKVSFTDHVEDGCEFVVVASSHNGAQAEKKFVAMTKGFIDVENARQVVEKGGNGDAVFTLDFNQHTEAIQDGVLALTDEQNRTIDPSYYSYDIASKRLAIHAVYLNQLFDGENVFKIITSRNAVAVEVVVATKFIYTAEDLASMNDTVDSLEGYYILMNDIDLSSYLKEGGKGYDDGKGWVPIGQYNDVTDPNIAVQKAFKGTFDGNGHVISNLYMKRKDVASFNAGLFGYVTSSSIIKNVGVTGTMDVSSYSGGLVGSNSGMITNCWADVDVTAYSGSDSVYRYLGGFVGNNFGIIEHCYSLGNVLCDSYFGAFVGSNEGDILECYALKGQKSQSFAGFALVDASCQLYEDEASFKEGNWRNTFSNEYWNIEDNSFPSLRILFQETQVRKMEINRQILQGDYYPGDKIPLFVDIYPLDLQEIYASKVEFTVEKNGGVLIQEGNILNLFNPVSQNVIVHASLHVDGMHLEDEMTISIGKKITHLEMITNTEVMKAGSRYRIGASYLPEDATEGIVYHLRGQNLVGVILQDDIITIREDTTCEQFVVYATTVNGKIKSNEVTIRIDPLHVLETQYYYPEELNEFTFDFADTIDLENVKVTLFGKEVSYSIDALNTIHVAKEVASNMQDTDLIFQFVLKDGTRYQQKVYLFSHSRYDENAIKWMYQDVIEISCKEDFYQYFNMSKNQLYDENKCEDYYDKVFMLTADIDFEGEEIYGIGYSLESGQSATFKGKFFGCGHTISNVVICQNEACGFLGDSAPYSYYGVGFFGALAGEIYDLNFEEVSANGKNFVGGVVGMMISGRVENCHVMNQNATIVANGQMTSSDDIHVGAIIGRCFEGKCVACSSNKNQIIG